MWVSSLGLFLSARCNAFPLELISFKASLTAHLVSCIHCINDSVYSKHKSRREFVQSNYNDRLRPHKFTRKSLISLSGSCQFCVLVFVHVSDGSDDIESNYLLSREVRFIDMMHAVTIDYRAHEWSSAGLNTSVQLSVYGASIAGYVRQDALLYREIKQLFKETNTVGSETYMVHKIVDLSA